MTNRYLNGIPEGSRANRRIAYLNANDVTPDIVAKVRKLDVIAQKRNQTMAQMALAWILRKPSITSALVGASSPEQIEDSINALKNLEFSFEELRAIDEVLVG